MKTQIIIISSLIACLIFGENYATAQDVRPVVKIGVIVPLSGDMALHGVEIQRAMKLALKQATQTHYSYKLLFEDNRLEAVPSVSAARRLLDVEHVDAVVTLWPPTASVVIPLTEQRHVLHYTISWDPELARRNKYVLSHQAMVDAIVHSTLLMLKDKGIKQAAFLHMEETGFNLGAGCFQRLAPELGVTITANEAFPPDGTDFRSLLDRVARSKPEAYLVWAVMPSMDIVIRQLRERNAAVPITGYLDYAQDLSRLQGAEYVSEMYASESFISAYKSAYDSAPVSKGANAYDIMKLLINAYEQSPAIKPSAEQLKAGLTKIRDYPGAVGVFSIDEYGNSAYSPVRRRVEGNAGVIVP
jgi:branched-chain amino acid transport system substrate-binding protein